MEWKTAPRRVSDRVIDVMWIQRIIAGCSGITVVWQRYFVQQTLTVTEEDRPVHNGTTDVGGPDVDQSLPRQRRDESMMGAERQGEA